MTRALGTVRNLSIRGKMLLGFAAVIGLVALGNLYGIASVGQIAAESLFARETAFQKVVFLTDVENLAKRMAESAATAADVGIPEPFSQATALRDEIQQKMAAASGAFHDDAQLGRDFENLRRQIDGHLQRGEELLKLAVDRQWAAFGPARKEFEETQNAILQQVGTVKARSVAELDGSLASIAQLTKRTTSRVLGVTALALVAAFLAAVYLSGGIVRPLQRLISMMKKARDGDLSVRAAVESGDETGALSQGFNEMVQDLQRHRNHLEELVDERTAQLETANQRLETELEIRQITEAARTESEELLRQVLHSVRAGIVIVDAERREILEANAFALKLIGARRDQVVGRKYGDFLGSTEGEVSGLANGESAIENLAAQLQRADGQLLPILTSIVPVTHNGRVNLIGSFIEATGA